MFYFLKLQLFPSWPRFPVKGGKQAYVYVHITKVFQPRGQKKFARRFRGDFVFGKNLVAFLKSKFKIRYFGEPSFFHEIFF